MAATERFNPGAAIYLFSNPIAYLGKRERPVCTRVTGAGTVTYPIPRDEQERLRALQDCRLLDTAPDPSFDRLTAMAARLLNAPMALVSLVDRDRQWFKSTHGLDVSHTPRDYALCAYTILTDGVFVVEDATKDARHADNPLVAGPLRLRTYAGVPLHSRCGRKIGSLCVIYTEVTSLSAEDLRTLTDLAALTEDAICRHLALTEAAEKDAKNRRLIAAQREHEALLKSMARAAQVGGWAYDIDTAELRWTAETRRIHGVDDDFQPEVGSAIDFYTVETQPIIQDAFTRCINDGVPYDLELQIEDRSGKGKWVRSIGQPVHDQGRIVGAVGAFQDISQEIDRRIELERRRAQADAANEAKSRFLATMSHEIRTPLNGVLGMIDLVARGELCPEQRERMKIATRSAEALLTLLTDVLDISRMEVGGLELHPGATDPAALIGEVAALFAPRAAEKSLGFETDLGDLPAAIMTDAVRLRQVLVNLTSNAIKFTDAGTVRIGCHIVGDDAARRIRFEVTDTGPGISKADQRRLFRHFSQVDNSATRRHDGSGLGLAISRQIAELMGGRIGLRSTPGKGSTFHVELPLVIAQSAQNDNLQEAPAEAAAQTDRTLDLLIAEDNEVNRAVIAAFCANRGHRFDMVTNGAEAVKAVKERHYDAVLMDIHMPVMDGVEATAAIRALDGPAGQVPIVAVTANAINGDRDRFIGAGMDAYLTKPLRADDLYALLDQLCGEPPTDRASAMPKRCSSAS
jgi:PAS domain S-box-containing protein